jgi:hypothetical protein
MLGLCTTFATARLACTSVSPMKAQRYCPRRSLATWTGVSTDHRKVALLQPLLAGRAFHAFSRAAITFCKVG